MTETILSLVGQHGVVIVFLTTLLASMGVPLPASFTLLAAGAFSAKGDLSLPLAGAAALGGTFLGDLAAYGLGRWGGAGLWDRLQRRPRFGRMMTRARTLRHRHAGVAVLLSRWPFSPLGPYVNYASGATRLPPLRFAPLCAAGDALWIALYMGLGHVFAARFKDVGHVMSLVVTGLALAAGLAVLTALARRVVK